MYVRETFPQIASNYIQNGQVRYEFRHYPLFSIHPQAELAAQATECAGEQGGFWEMHDELFNTCLLYTSDAADDLLCVDLGGRRTIKKKNTN